MTAKSAVCFMCGLRRPITGMLVITEVDSVEFIPFCSWKCVADHAAEMAH